MKNDNDIPFAKIPRMDKKDNNTPIGIKKFIEAIKEIAFDPFILKCLREHDSKSTFNSSNSKLTVTPAPCLKLVNSCTCQATIHVEN